MADFLPKAKRKELLILEKKKQDTIDNTASAGFVWGLGKKVVGELGYD